MINFEKLPSGDLRNTGEEYVLITPGYKRLIDVDGSFTIEEFEQILETAKAASIGYDQPRTTTINRGS